MSIFSNIFSKKYKSYYNKGIANYNRRKFVEAIYYFEKVLSECKHDMVCYNLAKFYTAQANKNLGMISFAAKDLENAINYFQAALRMNPRHFDLYFLLGICYNALGRYALAVDAFQKLLAIAPETEMPIQIKIGLNMQRLQLWDKSEAIFKSILKKKPHYADVTFYLALTMIGKEKFEQAAEHLENALRINPNYAEARLKFVQLLLYLEQPERAFEILQPMLLSHPDYADVQLLSALIALKGNKHNTAMLALQNALRINPNFVQARINLGLLHIFQGHKEKGMQHLHLALQLQPNDKVLQSIISTFQDSSEIIDNIESYLTGLDIRKHEDSTRFADDTFFQAHSFSELISLVNLSHALKLDPSLSMFLVPYLQAAIRKFPNYPDLHNSLGVLYLNLDKPQKARDAFEQALQINPGYLQAKINFFKALFRLNELDLACKVGKELLASDVNYPDVLFLQAKIFFKINKLKDSEQLVLQILKQKPNFSPARDLLHQISHQL